MKVSTISNKSGGSTIGNKSGGGGWQRGRWQQEQWRKQKGWWVNNRDGNSDDKGDIESDGDGGEGGRQRGLCPGR